MWVLGVAACIAAGAAVAAILGMFLPPWWIAWGATAAYLALLAVDGLIGLSSDRGCGENGALWFAGGSVVLTVLVLGPCVAWIRQDMRARGIAYLLPAFIVAFLLFALGFFVVVMTGLRGCR